MQLLALQSGNLQLVAVQRKFECCDRFVEHAVLLEQLRQLLAKLLVLVVLHARGSTLEVVRLADRLGRGRVQARPRKRISCHFGREYADKAVERKDLNEQFELATTTIDDGVASQGIDSLCQKI